jgi:hypothetical protein
MYNAGDYQFDREARACRSCASVAGTRPICKQRAQPTQLLRPASVDLLSTTHLRSAKIRHTGHNESARNLLPVRFAWFCQIAI